MKHTNSIADRTAGASRPHLSGLLDGTVRRGLHTRLGRFTAGSLLLIDGADSWVFGADSSDLQAAVTVHNKKFYSMISFGGSVGAAEAYIRGYWSTDDLVSLVRIFIRNQRVFTRRERTVARALRPLRRFYHYLRDNTLAGSKRNIAAHYDLGEDFYRLFLDPTMTYSCGVFKHPTSSLEDASIEKLDRICRKLRLSADDHVMEIGSGWGSFAVHAASRYNCRVTTTTISDRQYDYVVQHVKKAGLSEKITVLKQDYRTLVGAYDKLVSIEMIEAVGIRHIGTFIAQCSKLLKPHGVMALQAITISDQHFDDYRHSVDFIQTMVFPGASLVSISHLLHHVRIDSDMRLIDLEDITPHYAITLRHWRERFLERTDDVRSLGFSDQFIRLWEYYLAYCEGGFREAHIGDVQLIFAKPQYRPTTGLGDIP